MPRTVFYSWQSGLPNNTNRSLIRRALDEAVKSLNAELAGQLADALAAALPADGEVEELAFDEARLPTGRHVSSPPPSSWAPIRMIGSATALQISRRRVENEDDCADAVDDFLTEVWDAAGLTYQPKSR